MASTRLGLHPQRALSFLIEPGGALAPLRRAGASCSLWPRRGALPWLILLRRCVLSIRGSGLAGQVCSALSAEFGWASCRWCHRWSGDRRCLISCVGGRQALAERVAFAWFAEHQEYQQKGGTCPARLLPPVRRPHTPLLSSLRPRASPQVRPRPWRSRHSAVVRLLPTVSPTTS